jgi:acyl dehydratase
MGLYYEQCRVGLVLKHVITRTVTEMDNVLFTSLTMNVQPLHLSKEYARTTEYGRRVVNGVLTLGLVVGISSGDTVVGTSLGVLSFDRVTFHRPVFHGDTIRVETTVLRKRPSRSRPDAGIVTFEHRGINQHDEVVLAVVRKGLMLRRPVAAG